MCWIKPPLATTFERHMCGDKFAILEDADSVSQDMHVEHAPARGVGNAVEIAADADHALMGGAAFEPQDRLIWRQRPGVQSGFLFGEGLIDDPVRRCMDPGIGDRVEPMPQLTIEIVEIAE